MDYKGLSVSTAVDAGVTRAMEWDDVPSRKTGGAPHTHTQAGLNMAVTCDATRTLDSRGNTGVMARA